jgi:AcrR family transcriptional regulator
MLAAGMDLGPKNVRNLAFLSGSGSVAERRMTPEEIGRDQRRRLQGAMIEAVARHGYAGTTLGELVALASVSRTTFYDHFASKAECFWSTYQAIVDEVSEEVLEACSASGGRGGSLRNALKACAELVATLPDAASLVIVESLSLGSDSAEHRQDTAARFERALREFYAEAVPVSDSEVAVRGAVGGYRQVVYRSLRQHAEGGLAASAGELADWMLRYRGPKSRHVAPPSFFDRLATEMGDAARHGSDTGPPGWEEPPDSPRSRRSLTQRERIVRALGRLSAERGYANLSVPAISTTAGVSNQTFYQEFANKQEAFVVAFEELSGRALGFATEAFAAEREWPHAVTAALFSLLSFIASEPYFARLAYFELSAAGPSGLDRADAMMDRFLAPLEPAALPDNVEPCTEVVRQAIGGGIWAVIESELHEGRGQRLPELAPELADFALRPFGAP